VFGLSSVTSFWGVDNTAVEVGGEKITSQKLLLDFDRELRRMNSLGTYTSPQDAVKQGMLTDLIQNEAYALLKYQLTESLGTIASDEAVRNYILNNPSILYETKMEKLNVIKDNLNKAIVKNYDNSFNRFETVKLKLDLLNPKTILGKGYSIVYKDNKVVKDITKLSKTDNINIMVKNGSIDAKVEGINKNE
jgi:exonuclease VII large subunit